jgi:hypothetical protein
MQRPHIVTCIPNMSRHHCCSRFECMLKVLASGAQELEGIVDSACRKNPVFFGRSHRYVCVTCSQKDI